MEGNLRPDDPPSARSAAPDAVTRRYSDQPTREAAASVASRASAPTPLLRRRRAPGPSPEAASVASARRSDHTLRLVTGDYTEVDARPSPRPEAPLADPLLGRVVADRYRILELVGRGGMGSVYRVEHTRIGKLLAMKLLSGELSQRPEAVRRFKREALTVSKLTSPNTVQVFDFGASDGLTYLVMELVGGQSLGEVVRARGPLRWDRAARIGIQIASSLAEAHALGIVHRDIKPENVMIVPGEGGVDVAKVLDFGLAKLREPDDEVTGHGMVIGTPAYMAPEQIRGEAVDARSDVYSLGALLYRLLTGEPPFRSDATLSVLSKHLHEAPVPPRERAPARDIPVGLSRLVMRALRKRPEDRFARVEDLRAELVEELRAAGSSSAEGLLDPGRVRRLARPSAPEDAEAFATRGEVDAYERRLQRTRKGAIAAAIALVVAAALLVAGALRARPEAPTEVELEPNDTPAQATPVRLGRAVTGQIGRRVDATHGDRDLYAFDVPPAADGATPRVRLRLGAMPTMALCAILYRPGFAEPVGQYCPGRAGRELAIDGLALAPGRHVLAVLQDVDGYGGEPPAVQESISDSYVLLIELASASPASESEPNDDAASATRLAPGRAVTAQLGWARDEDVFCVDGGAGEKLRLEVRPGAHDALPLEITPVLDGRAGPGVRVAGGATATLALPATAVSRCARVRRPRDPGAVRASAASPPYVVELAR